MSSVAIYIAFDQKDVLLKDALKKRFIPQERQGKVRVWDAHDIHAGQETDVVIDENLNTADIILLLVSPDSLASKYFYSRDVGRAIQRHKQKEVIVIPILLRPCSYEDTPLGQIRPLPSNGAFVASKAWHSEDEAFHDIEIHVSERIRYVLQKKDFEAKAREATGLFERRSWEDALIRFEEAEKIAHADFKPEPAAIKQYIADCRTALRRTEFDRAVDQATSFYEKHNWMEALDAFRNALAIYQSDFEPSQYQLMRYIDACEIQIRQKIEQEQQKIKLEQYQDLVAKGEKAQREKDWERAEALFQAAAHQWKAEFPGITRQKLEERAKDAAREAGNKSRESQNRNFRDRHYIANLHKARRMAKMRLWLLVPFFADAALKHNPESEEALILIIDAKKKNKANARYMYGIPVLLMLSVLVFKLISPPPPEEDPLEEYVSTARTEDTKASWKIIMDSFPDSQYYQEAAESIERLDYRITFENDAKDILKGRQYFNLDSTFNLLINFSIKKHPNDSGYYKNRIREIRKNSR